MTDKLLYALIGGGLGSLATYFAMKQRNSNQAVTPIQFVPPGHAYSIDETLPPAPPPGTQTPPPDFRAVPVLPQQPTTNNLFNRYTVK